MSNGKRSPTAGYANSTIIRDRPMSAEDEFDSELVFGRLIIRWKNSIKIVMAFPPTMKGIILSAVRMDTELAVHLRFIC